jgi:hypothetical protein
MLSSPDLERLRTVATHHTEVVSELARGIMALEIWFTRTFRDKLCNNLNVKKW